jgi:hypothetical protein
MIGPNSKEVVKIHPIAFTSKQTSALKEKYKPFLLEFAALKFSLDKFSDFVWGFPVELETDCRVLRNHLTNNKLNSTHSRWHDGVLDHYITDVCHRPGRLNPVADGLSHQYVGKEIRAGDGHEWTVSEDWEARTGLTHDVFAVSEAVTTPEYATLRTRFKDERIFLEVVEALGELDHGKSLCERKRARHRASGYMIAEGKLWRIPGGKSICAEARVECVTRAEAREMAWNTHRDSGHFGRDMIKIQLLSKICSPGLDQSIMQAITGCGRCKGFGAAHIHSLLEPITRRHPFELMVCDTLSMSPGKGGYKKLGLYADLHSQKLWVRKLKTAATGMTTRTRLESINHDFPSPKF